MTKHKHNKKQNTGFLYNALLVEMAKASINKDAFRKNACLSIFKEHFGKDSLLRQELKLYKQLEQSSCSDEKTAERVLNETKRQISSMDGKLLEDARVKMSGSMKKKLGTEVFDNFVSNYTHLASIAQVFNSKISPRNKILLENQIISQMCATPDDKKALEPIDNLVVRAFVKRFNDTYSILEEEQTKLLSKYIFSFSDDGTDLRLFLESELKRIKSSLKNVLETQDHFANQGDIPEKIKSVLVELDTFKTKPVDEVMLEKVLKAQRIVREVL